MNSCRSSDGSRALSPASGKSGARSSGQRIASQKQRATSSGAAAASGALTASTHAAKGAPRRGGGPISPDSSEPRPQQRSKSAEICASLARSSVASATS